MAEDAGRISVSRDALRAELSQMELRLVEKLATKAEVDDLTKRVTALEERNAPTRVEFDLVKSTLTALKSGLALVSVVAASALPLILRHYLG